MGLTVDNIIRSATNLKSDEYMDKLDVSKHMEDEDCASHLLDQDELPSED